MKRITIGLAAFALMLVAADSASAQGIRIVGGNYGPGYARGYAPGYVAPSYIYRPSPVYVVPPVYSVPSVSAFYSTPIGNGGRINIGYSSGWGGSYTNYNYYSPSVRYHSSYYGSPYGGYPQYHQHYHYSSGWRR